MDFEKSQIIKTIGNYEELSDDALETFTTLEAILEDTNFPIKSRKSKDTPDRTNIYYGDEEITAMCLGYVKSYAKSHLVNAQFNRKHPLLLETLVNLMKIQNPRFKYTSIQVNKNTKTNWHYDKNNEGYSYCIGIGEGGIMFENEIYVENNRKWFVYNGKVHRHKTIQNGDCRYAIIYFTRKGIVL